VPSGLPSIKRQKYENKNRTIGKMLLWISIAIFLSVFSQSFAAECPKIVTQKDFNATRVNHIAVFH